MLQESYCSFSGLYEEKYKKKADMSTFFFHGTLFQHIGEPIIHRISCMLPNEKWTVLSLDLTLP